MARPKDTAWLIAKSCKCNTGGRIPTLRDVGGQLAWYVPDLDGTWRRVGGD